MTAIIGPGSRVRCVDTRPYKGQPVDLQVGSVYTVLAVWDELPHLGTDATWMDCAVTLEEVPDPEPGIAWGLYRFEPLDGWTPVRTRQLEAA